MLIFALLIAVIIFFFPEQTYKLFGENPAYWRKLTAIAIVGVVWIFLKPILAIGSTLEDAVNEATMMASLGVLIVTIAYWNGAGSLIPAVATFGFYVQATKHRFLD